ncbi:glycosyltransferase family 8 protein [Treponema berlinense]|uniref:glycosyltransferase family 8 protein n=1 Tax=Treponema berlinense TaxID=225004 RepID=UPI0026F10454|nr:glycosyltransferase family 8 protein [Treponema berlinense]
MSDDTINVALCTDDNFIYPTLTTIDSVLKNNTDQRFSIFIITAGLSEQSRKTVENFSLNKQGQAEIKIITAEKKILSGCPIKQGDHVSLSSYLRILLPGLIPENIKKVLYLDGDILCVSSLKELYDIDISQNSCAAVRDERNNDAEIFTRLNYSSENGYFNAGVILINLDWWRKNNVQNTTLKYISENQEKCLWHDQDALNYILNGTVAWLDFRYNLTQGFLFDKPKLKIDEKYKNAISSAIKNPCLIHYCAAYKPWHVECNSPFKKLWRENYRETFGKKCRLTFKNKGKSKIKWCLKFVLNALHIKKYADFRKSILEG